MTYSLIVHNSTGSTIDASDGKTVKPGDVWKAEGLGNAYFHSDEVGSLSFRDIGQEHISGDSKGTWGVLLTYQGRHVVGRYDGDQGLLEITWDKHLQALVGGKMELRHVLLDPLVTLLKAPEPKT
jgi:hypothetical protein